MSESQVEQVPAAASETPAPRKVGRPASNKEPRRPAAEVKREALSAKPNDPKYGTDEERIAVITREGDQCIATYNGVVIGKVKRPHDLYGLLVEHRYTHSAKMANISKLHFEFEVGSMPSEGGKSKFAENAKKIVAIIDNMVDADGRMKTEPNTLVATLREIRELALS